MANKVSEGKKFADELIQLQHVAQMVLLIGSQRRLFAETTVKQGWYGRYLDMSVAEQSELAKLKEPTGATYAAALKLAGAVISEHTQRTLDRVTEMMVTRGDLVPVQEMDAHGRPVLIDTPESRKAALSHFDFGL